MKKILIGVAVVAVALGTAAFVYRDRIGMMIAFNRLEPEVSFAEAAATVRAGLFAGPELGSAPGSR